VFLEHDWNPFVDLQAMDRAHRIGQSRPVTVYRLVAEATIEARVLALQGLKRAVVGEIINEGNSAHMDVGVGGLGNSLWSSLVSATPDAGTGPGQESSDGAVNDETSPLESLDIRAFLETLQ
jgi:TATA-binding protein-associated factor